MSTISVVWPFSGGPENIEVFDALVKSPAFLYFDHSPYISVGTVAAALTGGFSGTLYGGGKKIDTDSQIYLYLDNSADVPAKLPVIYGGGSGGDTGSVYIYAKAGSYGTIYGTSSNAAAGDVNIWIDAAAAVSKGVYLGKGKAASATLTVSGTGALEGFTGILDGKYKNVDSGKSAYGTLVFSEASLDGFGGKIANFASVKLVDSTVLLDNFEKSANYKNIAIYDIDPDSTLTFNASKKYTRTLGLTGNGAVNFTGAGLHVIKAQNSKFSGTVTVADDAALEIQGTLFSTTVNAGTLALGENALLRLNSDSLAMAAKLKGGATSTIAALKSATLSGSFEDFTGTLQIDKNAVLTVKTSLDAEKVPQLNVFFAHKSAVLSLTGTPTGSVMLNLSGQEGAIVLGGSNNYKWSGDLGELSIYGAGTALNIDQGEESAVIKAVYAGAYSSTSVYMTSYALTITSGNITGVFGGGRGVQSSLLGSATNKLTVNGGTIGDVYGGGFSENANCEAGDITLTITGGAITGNVYGGGYAAKSGFTATSASVSINISGGVIGGDIYGGGRSGGARKVFQPTGSYRYYSDGVSKVSGDVQITLDGQVEYSGNIHINGESKSTCYIGGDENFVKFAHVYTAADAPEIEDDGEGEGGDGDEPEIVDRSLLLAYRGVIDGLYYNTSGKKSYGEMILSDYRGEFLGTLKNLSALALEEKSAVTLNWDEAKKRFVNIQSLEADEDSELTLNSTALKLTLKNDISGEGTITLNMVSGAVCTFDGGFYQFQGTLNVADDTVLLIKKSATVSSTIDDGVINLGGNAVLQLNTYGKWSTGVSGGENTQIILCNKAKKVTTLSGDLTEFDGTVKLENSSRGVVNLASGKWDELNFYITGKKSVNAYFFISGGDGTVNLDGSNVVVYMGGSAATLINREAVDTVVYAGSDYNISSSNATIGGDESSVKIVSAFAGGEESKVTNAKLTVTGGSVGEVYGGGSGKGAEVASSQLVLSGGTIGNVYGGGQLAVKGKNTVKSVVITVCGANITGDIYAGGAAGKSGDVAVENAEIIFSNGAIFAGTVHGGGVNEKRSTSEVGNSTVTFDGYQGAFGGTLNAINELKLTGDTVMSFAPAQDFYLTLDSLIFDISQRTERADAILTATAGSYDFSATKSRLIRLERSSLLIGNPGETQSFVLTVDATYGAEAEFSITGLHGDTVNTVTLGETITIADETYLLEMNGGVLSFNYTIGTGDEVILNWPESFFDRYAPLTAKAYAADAPLNAANYGYTDHENNTSLKVKIAAALSDDLAVDTAGVSGNLWLNLAAAGTNIDVSGEAVGGDLNVAVMAQWGSLTVGEYTIGGDGYIALQTGGSLGTLDLSARNEGVFNVGFNGGTASAVDGGGNQVELLFDSDYDALDSTITAVNSIGINADVVFSGGGITACQTLTVGGEASLEVALAAEDDEFVIETFAFDGDGAFTVGVGTVKLDSSSMLFKGAITVNDGGTLEIVDGTGFPASASLEIKDGGMLKVNIASDLEVKNTLKGAGGFTVADSVPEAGEKTLTFSGALKDYSGVIAMDGKISITVSGTIGSALKVSGTTANTLDFTGKPADGVSSSSLYNTGALVLLNAASLVIAENSGVIVYGGSGDYKAKDGHSFSLTDKTVTAATAGTIFGGASGADTVVGDGATIDDWEKVDDGVAVLIDTSSLGTKKFDALYGGSRGGKVDGDIYLELESGEFGAIYGGGLDCNVDGNIWMQADGSAVFGNINLGGSGENAAVSGDLNLQISGKTTVNGDIRLNNASGRGTVTLSAAADTTALAGFTGTIHGEYIAAVDNVGGESVPGTGKRVLNFTGYINQFAGSLDGFNQVVLTGSTVTLSGGESQLVQAESISISSDSKLAVANSHASFESIFEGETLTIGGAGTLAFDGYSGDFDDAVIHNLSQLAFSGEGSVAFGDNGGLGSGVVKLDLDLSVRGETAGAAAVMTVSDAGVFDFAGMQVNITVDLTKLDADGSYLLIKSGYELTPGEAFTLADGAGNSVTLTVGETVGFGGNNWQLSLTDDGRELSLSWESIISEPSGAIPAGLASLYDDLSQEHSMTGMLLG